MKLKFYSEVLNQYFDTKEDCKTAEEKYYTEQNKKHQYETEKQEAQKALDKLREDVELAYDKADELFDDYIQNSIKYAQKYDKEVYKILTYLY